MLAWCTSMPIYFLLSIWVLLSVGSEPTPPAYAERGALFYNALTKALLGSLAASARENRGAVVVNVSSDAAINAYPFWGAYGVTKAALRQMSGIWNEELSATGVSFLSVDPGDMDTPLHAAALPDADRTMLKSPVTAARELAETVAVVLAGRSLDTVTASPERLS
jgi:NAD(P)-dependent dehydrogenase (short-subunit alcohol dehydrogenase family)